MCPVHGQFRRRNTARPVKGRAVPSPTIRLDSALLQTKALRPLDNPVTLGKALALLAPISWSFAIIMFRVTGLKVPPLGSSLRCR
jgi:hypothetical protein